MRDTASMRDAGMRDSISHNTLLQHHVTTISRPVHVQQRLQPTAKIDSVYALRQI